LAPPAVNPSRGQLVSWLERSLTVPIIESSCFPLGAVSCVG
jgi:hypothetical protein